MKVKPLTFQLPEICYLSPSNQYYLLCGDEWVKQDRSTVERYLISIKVCPVRDLTTHQSDLDSVLLHLSTDQYVQYAGRVAGYNAGVYEMCRQRVLVPQSPTLTQPVPGSYPLLQQMFLELFGLVQLPYFYGWLHLALTMLHTQTYRPGQALIMAGPAGCGKTLVQDIITELFGGRKAKPYQYMSGGTPFNSELLEAEHLVIADETQGKDAGSRGRVKAAINGVRNGFNSVGSGLSSNVPTFQSVV